MKHFPLINLSDGAQTRKLLRFGTDQPQCADCGLDDSRFLCDIIRNGRTRAILCRNCNAKRKPLTVQAATQEQRRFAASGYPKPSCVVCGEVNLRVLELDHVAGIANSPFVAPLCANHHGVKSSLAEQGPMAALRRRDPERSALLLQAAFDFGLGSVLSIFAAVDGARDETARSICFAVAAAALFAWALWNLAADRHFTHVLGQGYDRAVPATVPT